MSEAAAMRMCRGVLHAAERVALPFSTGISVTMLSEVTQAAMLTATRSC